MSSCSGSSSLNNQGFSAPTATPQISSRSPYRQPRLTKTPHILLSLAFATPFMLLGSFSDRLQSQAERSAEAASQYSWGRNLPLEHNHHARPSPPERNPRVSSRQGARPTIGPVLPHLGLFSPKQGNRNQRGRPRHPHSTTCQPSSPPPFRLFQASGIETRTG